MTKTATVRYANASDPMIAAIISEMFRFTTIEQSDERLKQLREVYIVSKPKTDEPTSGLTLWIKGYDVTDEEKENGFIGNYAVLTSKKVAGKYSITSTKKPMELKNHPQRLLVKQRVANWGFPLLRSVKADKDRYSSIEEAQKFLLKLHGEFPETSIPNPGKLYIMIYSKEPKPGVKKHALEIKAHPDGGFHIEWRLNNYDAGQKSTKDKKTIKRVEPTSTKAEAEMPGYFASKELLKKNTKRKRASKTLPEQKVKDVE